MMEGERVESLPGDAAKKNNFAKYMRDVKVLEIVNAKVGANNRKEYLIKFHAWVPEDELAEEYKDLIADYWDDVNGGSDWDDEDEEEGKRNHSIPVAVDYRHVTPPSPSVPISLLKLATCASQLPVASQRGKSGSGSDNEGSPASSQATGANDRAIDEEKPGAEDEFLLNNPHKLKSDEHGLPGATLGDDLEDYEGGVLGEGDSSDQCSEEMSDANESESWSKPIPRNSGFVLAGVDRTPLDHATEPDEGEALSDDDQNCRASSCRTHADKRRNVEHDVGLTTSDRTVSVGHVRSAGKKRKLKCLDDIVRKISGRPFTDRNDDSDRIHGRSDFSATPSTPSTRRKRLEDHLFDEDDEDGDEDEVERKFTPTMAGSCNDRRPELDEKAAPRAPVIQVRSEKSKNFDIKLDSNVKQERPESDPHQPSSPEKRFPRSPATENCRGNVYWSGGKAFQKVHKSFQCSICGQRFDNEDNLKSHESKHEGMKCKNCDQVFFSEAKLKDHRITAHKARQKYHKCQYCSILHADRSVLERHEQSHFTKVQTPQGTQIVYIERPSCNAPYVNLAPGIRPMVGEPVLYQTTFGPIPGLVQTSGAIIQQHGSMLQPGLASSMQPGMAGGLQSGFFQQNMMMASQSGMPVRNVMNLSLQVPPGPAQKQHYNVIDPCEVLRSTPGDLAWPSKLRTVRSPGESEMPTSSDVKGDESSAARRSEVRRELIDRSLPPMGGFMNGDISFPERSRAAEETNVAKTRADSYEDADGREERLQKCRERIGSLFPNSDPAELGLAKSLKYESEYDGCSQRFHPNEGPTDGSERYVCPLCRKSFAKKDTLDMHVQNTHNHSQLFTCEVCHESFLNKEVMESHMVAHQKQDFSCSICGKQFDRRSAYETHLRSHTNERPFQCHVCGRAFSLRTNLRRHSLIHTDITPYVCQVCYKGFRRSDMLNAHMKQYHDSVPNPTKSRHGFIASDAARKEDDCSSDRDSPKPVERRRVEEQPRRYRDREGAAQEGGERMFSRNAFHERDRDLTIMQDRGDPADQNRGEEDNDRDQDQDRDVRARRDDCNDGDRVRTPGKVNRNQDREHEDDGPERGKDQVCDKNRERGRQPSDDGRVGNERERRQESCDDGAGDRIRDRGNSRCRNESRCTDRKSEEESAVGFERDPVDRDERQFRTKADTSPELSPLSEEINMAKARALSPDRNSPDMGALRDAMVVDSHNKFDKKGSIIPVPGPIPIRPYDSSFYAGKIQPLTITTSCSNAGHSPPPPKHSSQGLGPAHAQANLALSKPARQAFVLAAADNPLAEIRALTCADCGEVFTSRSLFDIHVESHSRDTYKCDKCSRTFSRRVHFETHMQSHEGIKSHHCPYCHRAFSMKGNLRRHIRIHTNEAPYECPICFQRFRRSDGLKGHIKRHEACGEGVPADLIPSQAMAT